LPPGTENVVIALRRSERRLGRIHDLDLALARVRRLHGEAPKGLQRALKRLRRRQVNAFAVGFPADMKRVRDR